MKRFLVAPFLLLLSVIGLCGLRADESDAWTPVEKQVAQIAASPKVTIVHFWAPWCPNCQTELNKFGWRDFLSVNPDVNVVFVTIWNPEDGRAELQKYGVGDQANFQLILHPNSARTKEERVNKFLGEPIDWIPTTWVFRDGKLRFALNYGEIHFSMLQQLVRDATDKWEHSGTKTKP